jgi:hypothetical protein
VLVVLGANLLGHLLLYPPVAADPLALARPISKKVAKVNRFTYAGLTAP